MGLTFKITLHFSALYFSPYFFSLVTSRSFNDRSNLSDSSNHGDRDITLLGIISIRRQLSNDPGEDSFYFFNILLILSRVFGWFSTRQRSSQFQNLNGQGENSLYSSLLLVSVWETRTVKEKIVNSNELFHGNRWGKRCFGAFIAMLMARKGGRAIDAAFRWELVSRDAWIISRFLLFGENLRPS